MEEIDLFLDNDNSLEFTHKFVKRRLFRDFEDYTLYLNGQNSRYNILPMNKDYDFTVYDNGNNTTTKIIKDGIQLTKENLHLFSYSIPYTNCPSFFKLAYIIKIK